MIKYRGKPDKITRVSLLSALGNAASLPLGTVVKPNLHPSVTSDPSLPGNPDPLPVPFSRQSIRDFYLPALIARIPGSNFDSSMLNALLKVLARSEARDEFDRTVSRFVYKDPDAPFPDWVGMVETESLNPKVRRTMERKRAFEPHHLTHPNHAPQPDKITWYTVLSALSRRPQQQGGMETIEAAQKVWKAMRSEKPPVEKDAELVNALLSCAASGQTPSLAVDIAKEEFELGDEQWDGEVEELADPAMVRPKVARRGRKRAASIKLEKDSKGLDTPVPNIKTLSILLESVLRSYGDRGVDAGRLVLGWWKQGRFDLGPNPDEDATPQQRKASVNVKLKLDDYCAFLLMRTVGLVHNRGSGSKGKLVIDSSAEELWTVYNMLLTSDLLAKKSPRTAGVVMDACWKAVAAITDAKDSTVVGGKDSRLEIWSSRGTEIWKAYGDAVRDLARNTDRGFSSEDSRNALHLIVAYGRFLIELGPSHRNKDHLARILLTGHEILKHSGVVGQVPVPEARLKWVLAAVLRKLARDTISDPNARADYTKSIKETGWYSPDTKWDGRMGGDYRGGARTVPKEEADSVMKPRKSALRPRDLRSRHTQNTKYDTKTLPRISQVKISDEGFRKVV
jgi:hypothetical protein